MYNKSTNIGLLILRIGIGGTMLLHGISKIVKGIGPIQAMVVDAGMPAFIAYGVYLGEVLAPLLIILGIATRLGSFIFAVNCLVAIIMAHSTQILQLTNSGGWAIELLALYLFGSIALIFTGGGKFAVSKRNFWD